MTAAKRLGSQGVTTVFTQLGEDIAERAEAEVVTTHYLEVLETVHAQSVRSHVSLKLTQLGNREARDSMPQGFRSRHVSRGS